MPKFFEWLSIEPKGEALWKFLALVVLMNCGYASWVYVTTSAFVIDLPDSKVLEDLIREHTLIFFALLPFLAALEELIFRLPLAIFLKYNIQPGALLVVAVLLSILFGLAHGGLVGVPIQGIMGLVFCVVFLKCGGLQMKYQKAFLSSTAVHFTYNILAFSIFLLFGT